MSDPGGNLGEFGIYDRWWAWRHDRLRGRGTGLPLNATGEERHANCRVQHQALRPPVPGRGQRPIRTRAPLPRAATDGGDGAPRRGLPRRLRVRERPARPPCARDPGGRRHATGGAALRRLQQCRSPCRRGAGDRGRPRAGLLATRGGGVHGRPDPLPQPPHPPGLRAHPRQQLRAGRAFGIRSARPDGGRDRHWRTSAPSWPG